MHVIMSQSDDSNYLFFRNQKRILPTMRKGRKIIALATENHAHPGGQYSNHIYLYMKL